MNQITRRSLLRATALVPVTGFVACATATSVPAAVKQAASDAALIGGGLLSALKALPVGVLPTDKLTSITTWLTDISTVANSMASAPTTGAAAPMVQQIEGLMNSVVGAVAGLALPGSFGTAISAAQVLLPVIEVAVGLVVPAAARRMAMSPDQARLVLAGAWAGNR